MAIILPPFQQLTGIDFLGFYGPVLFRTIGLKESAALMYAMVITFASTTFKLIAMVVVDRLGRCVLFSIGGVQMFVPSLFIGSIMAAHLGDHSTIRKGYAYLTLVFLCAFVAGFALSWRPLTWLVASEIFPLEIRSAGQSIVVAISLLLKFIIAQMSLAMLCHLTYGTLFFFGGWVFVMIMLMHMLLTETKGVSIEQLGQAGKDHWFWKKIVNDRDGSKIAIEFVTG